jgi:hypothetical protein
MFCPVNKSAGVWGEINQQNNRIYPNPGIGSKKFNNLLAIGFKTGYVPNNQLYPALCDRDGFFLKENSICQSGILQFATLKIL